MSKKQTKPETVSFNGPAGETHIPLTDGMVDDLPAMWQLRLEDTINAYRRADYGDAEFMVRVAAIFTNLPDVPGNQRIDPKLLERGNPDKDLVRELVEAGAAIMPYLVRDVEDDVEVESGNA